MSAKDISRFLFQPHKRYSSVRMQQGRVILDSDWNESEQIDDEEARRLLAETICANGTPNDGLLVADITAATVTVPPAPSKATYDFALGSGSFYLGGLRFEVVAEGPDITERFLSQSDWLQIDANLGNLPARPSVADLTNADGSFKVRHDLVYLRGWEQCVTAVEDSELRERALGGGDTSVRMRLMRRMEVLPNVALDLTRGNFCAEAFAALQAQLTAPREGDGTGEPHLFDEANCELRSKAKLTVKFGGGGITEDPCKPTVTKGFLGAENQTIRVQLTATNRFIWGYDNASPFYRVQVLEEAGQPSKIKFLTLPRDQAAQPLKGQAVEILPWGAFLPNKEKVAELQGHLATVTTSFDPEEKTITLSKPVPQAWIDWLNAPAHKQYLSERDRVDKYFYLRLWTGGSGDANAPDHLLTPGTAVELLGTGLNVTFSQHGLPGDCWIIAARPNTPDVVVPWELMAQAPPAGTRFFFAPLALISWRVGRDTVEATVEDCRHTFRPLCEVRDEGIQVLNVLAKDAYDQDITVRNDMELPAESLAKGLRLLLKQNIDPTTVSEAVCSVTLELPFPTNQADQTVWGDALIGYQPLILAASVEANQPREVLWNPFDDTQTFLLGNALRKVKLRKRQLKFEQDWDFFDPPGSPPSKWSFLEDNLAQQSFAAGIGNLSGSSIGLGTISISKKPLREDALSIGLTAIDINNNRGINSTIGMVFNLINNTDYFAFVCRDFFDSGIISTMATVIHVQGGRINLLEQRGIGVRGGGVLKKINLDIKQSSTGLIFAAHIELSVGGSISSQFTAPQPQALLKGSGVGMYTCFSTAQFTRLEVVYPDARTELISPGAHQALARLTLKRNFLQLLAASGSQGNTLPPAGTVQPQADFEQWFWLIPAVPRYPYSGSGSAGMGIGGNLI